MIFPDIRDNELKAVWRLYLGRKSKKVNCWKVITGKSNMNYKAGGKIELSFCCR